MMYIPIKILQNYFGQLAKFEIAKNILTISIDNASNNNLIVDHIQNSVLLPCHGSGDFSMLDISYFKSNCAKCF